MTQDHHLLLFVIVIILAAFLGMSIVLQIVRALPLSGVGYGVAPAVNSSRDNSSGSGIGSWIILLLLILLACAFWFSTRQPATDTDEPPDTNYHESPTSKISPLRDNETYSINRDDVPTDANTNRAPSLYTIQLIALASEEAARAFMRRVPSGVPADVIEQDSLYKVVVGRFSTKEKATRYKAEYQIDGFVKKININYEEQT